jgi:hypothetical protein
MNNDKAPWWSVFPSPNPNESGGISDFWAECGIDTLSLQSGATRYGRCDSGVFIKEDERASVWPTVKEICTKYGLRTIVDLSYIARTFPVTYKLVSSDSYVMLRLDKDVLDIDVETTNKELADEVCAYINKIRTQRASKGKVYAIVSGNSGFRLESIGVAAVPFEPTNYSPEAVAAYEHIVADLKTSSPTGRVIILDGNPGTGKTYMVRSILGAVQDAIFVVVPPEMVQSLGSPSLIPMLLEIKKGSDAPIAMIVEDADSVIVPRAADNMSSISAILNWSDGIMGSLLDMRIICTTNAKVTSIEPALMRPGRLSKRIEIGKIRGNQMNAVYKRLTGKEGSFDPREAYCLSEAYQAAIGNEISASANKDKKIGFSPDEDGED